MRIRPLETLAECRLVAELEKTVWGYTDAEDVVPPPVLMVSIKRGGILLGAFDGRDEIQGFVYSIPGIKDGRSTQWSRTTRPPRSTCARAVTRDWRGSPASAVPSTAFSTAPPARRSRARILATRIFGLNGLLR